MSDHLHADPETAAELNAAAGAEVIPVEGRKLTAATPENMRRFRDLNPPRELEAGGYVEPRRCFAYSPTTGERASAEAGDYFALGAGDVLTDHNGEPMVLATERTIYRDALTGEQL
jgi:hypothetical protein